MRVAPAEYFGFLNEIKDVSLPSGHDFCTGVPAESLLETTIMNPTTTSTSMLRGKELTRRVDIGALPKVLLHEHLDGGLRPATVIELAAELGYKGLPTTDPGDLADWFHRGAQKGNLPEYLEGFEHTIAVMQTPETLERVAFEFIEDMHRDGVVYAEVRFAPVYHTARGLTQRE